MSKCKVNLRNVLEQFCWHVWFKKKTLKSQFCITVLLRVYKKQQKTLLHPIFYNFTKHLSKHLISSDSWIWNHLLEIDYIFSPFRCLMLFSHNVCLDVSVYLTVSWIYQSMCANVASCECVSRPERTRLIYSGCCIALSLRQWR